MHIEHFVVNILIFTALTLYINRRDESSDFGRSPIILCAVGIKSYGKIWIVRTEDFGIGVDFSDSNRIET